MLKKCLNCGKKLTKIQLSKRKNVKFCSHKCYSLSIKGKHSSPKTEFKKGFNPWHSGKKLPQLSGSNANNWKGGIIERMGYISIYMPDHPYSNEKYYFEHRLVAEKIIGRYLTKTEVIHHINRIRTDNRPENLYLFSTNSKHISYENSKNSPEIKSNLTYIFPLCV